MTVLSVVIPALNEEDGIAQIIERVLATRPALAEVKVDKLELIIVDDGSTDRTPEIVESYPDVRLIKHPVNKGYGAAIKTGFRHATGDLLAFMDADGTYPPEYYPQQCQALFEQEADLVIGSRMAGAKSQMPLVRRIGNIIFANLVSLVANERISDSASGQRVLRREILPKLYPLPDGLNFTPVMSTRALHEDVKMIEVAIPYSEREGRSKLSVVKDGYRFLSTIVGTAFTYNPVRILGGIGVVMVLLGLLTAFLTFSLQADLSSWSFARYFLALVLVAVGVNLFSVGTLFNYIVSLFHKRKIRQGLLGRPLFKKPFEQNFGWLGIVSVVMGVVVYGMAVLGNLTQVTAAAPWFLPAVSTILALTGIQLIAAWFMVRTLSILSDRDVRVETDMGAERAEVATAGAVGFGRSLNHLSVE
jgi:glycosyltransferase involved in cell wall biosynthesis